MGDLAITESGCPVLASDQADDVWEAEKAGSTLGQYVMPCCKSPAVLKTSPNGVKFFAHHSDECATSPESIWHLDAKTMILQGLTDLGVDAKLEVPGKSASGRWQADIYFEHGGRKIVVEVQHSYQSLSKYFERQNRYAEAGVECYWVLFSPRFTTLTKSISKHRIRNEFGGQFPKDRNQSVGEISTLPVVWLVPEEDEAIRAPMFYSLTIRNWLMGVLTKQFYYSSNGWRIHI